MRLGVASHEKVVVCYVGTWAAYRKLDGKYDITHVDPQLCTHIIYGFAGLDNQTYELKPLDPWLDLFDKEKGGGHGMYEMRFKKNCNDFSKHRLKY